MYNKRMHPPGRGQLGALRIFLMSRASQVMRGR